MKSLNYIKDNNDQFWIHNYTYNNTAYGYPVYTPSHEGSRLCKQNNMLYKKQEGIVQLLPEHYSEVYRPKECYQKMKNDLPEIWTRFIEAINAVGIDDSNIGVFGSTLCDFPIIKDVDFIIYGEENLYKYYNSHRYIKEQMNAGNISKEHIEYQYHKYKSLYSPKMDLGKILSNNWSGVQLSNGVLSTPRFILDENYSIPKTRGNDELVSGYVKDSLFSSCSPRIFTLEVNGHEYLVITPFWMLQSCVRDNNAISVFGNVNHHDKIIILISYQHFLRFN